MQKDTILKADNYQLQICSEGNSLILSLSHLVSDEKTDIYESRVNSINQIESFKQYFNELAQFQEYIKDPNNIQVVIQEKRIVVTDTSKLKKKKIQIISIPLKYKKTIIQDRIQEILQKIQDIKKQPEITEITEIKQLLENMINYMLQTNKQRKKNRQTNQLLQKRIQNIEDCIQTYKIQLDQKIHSHKKSLNNNLIQNQIDYLNLKLQQLQTSRRIQQISQCLKTQRSQFQNKSQEQQSSKIKQQQILKLKQSVYNNCLDNSDNQQQYQYNTIKQELNELSAKNKQLQTHIAALMNKNKQFVEFNKNIGKKIVTQIKQKVFNKIYQVQRNIYDELTEIRHILDILELPHNRKIIQQISKTLDSENKLEKIIHRYENEKKLTISMNEKTTIIPQTISELTKLKQLNVCNNTLSLSELNELGKNLQKIKSLTALNLQNLGTKQAPTQIFSLTQLQTLNLSYNQNFIKLPKEIGYMNRLKQLYLFKCPNIQELPIEFGKLTSLFLLYLPEGLTYIPSWIGNLTNLQHLCADDSKINSLPKQIMNLKKLQIIHLSNARLTHIPIQLFMLKSLRSIILQNNQIRQLPKQVGNLSNLIQIWLNNNKIIHIPESMSNLPKSTEIKLKNNPFNNDTQQFLAQMKSQGFQKLQY